MSNPMFWNGMQWLGLALLGWHLLAFVLCGTGLLLVRVLGRQGPALRSHILRGTIVGILVLPIFSFFPPLEKISASKKIDSIESREPAVTVKPFAKLEWEKVAVWRPVFQEMSLTEVMPEAATTGQFSWKSFLAG